MARKHTVAMVTTSLLLGGCQELSCQLSNYLEAGGLETRGPRAPEDGETPASEAEAPSTEAEAPSTSAATDTVVVEASLVHFKAFADDGYRPTLSAKLDVEVSDPAEAERLYVHGKGRCHSDGNIATSTASAQISTLDSWNLDLFTDHAVSFDHCQIDVRLAGEDGAISRPLGTYCFTDGTTASGECPQSVLPPSPPSGAAPLRWIGTDANFEDGLELAFELQPSVNAGHELEVVARTVCLVDGVHYLESESVSFSGGAFDFLPGETYGGKIAVFDDDKWSSLKLGETTCQMTFEAKDLSLFEDSNPHRIHTVCSREGALTDGPCKGFPSANFTKAEGLDAMKVRKVEGTIAPSMFGNDPDLRFALEVTATGPMGGSVYPYIVCKGAGDPQEATARWDGTDVADLREGESAKVWINRSSDSTPLDALQWCELKLTQLGRDEPVARYCWNGKKTREQGCEG